MKKNYCVSVDITMAKNIFVEAENEEQAKEIVREKMKYPHYYYSKADAFVNYEITDIYEED